MDIAVRPGRIRGTLLVPGAKSIAQRALVLATHRGGTIRNVPDGEDVSSFCEGLRALGYRVEEHGSDRVVSGAFHDREAHLFLGDNGTGARCLLALAALRGVRTVVDGSPRLRNRPVAPLCEALRRLGAHVDGDAFPVAVQGPLRGAEIRVSTDVSSQFATALILLVERVPGLRVKVVGARSSAYVTLTAHVLRHFDDPYVVEPDFSSAATLATAAAVTRGDLLLERLSLSSPQPDARVGLFLNAAGARVTAEDSGVRVRGGTLRGIRADVSSCPDLAPLLGVLGLFGSGATWVTGAPHLVFKESNRIATTAALLRAVGGEVEERPDGFVVAGGRPLHPASVDAAGDHRIALAGGVLALSLPGVTVTGAESVGKSYPRFFEDLEKLTE